MGLITALPRFAHATEETAPPLSDASHRHSEVCLRDAGGCGVRVADCFYMVPAFSGPFRPGRLGSPRSMASAISDEFPSSNNNPLCPSITSSTMPPERLMMAGQLLASASAIDVPQPSTAQLAVEGRPATEQKTCVESAECRNALERRASALTFSAGPANPFPPWDVPRSLLLSSRVSPPDEPDVPGGTLPALRVGPFTGSRRENLQQTGRGWRATSSDGVNTVVPRQRESHAASAQDSPRRSIVSS